MRVGIDFDNTIAGYDRVFIAATQARGWVAADFCGSKRELRDSVRLLPDGEIKWQMLQGEVYGARMAEATPFPGVVEFFKAARAHDLELFIVSHKTRHSAYDPQRIDLRQAALGWLEAQGFLDPAGFGLARERVFFEETRADKIARIKAIGCEVFIDDLEEVFVDPAFPDGIDRILFGPSQSVPSDRITCCASWDEIGGRVLGTQPAATSGLAAIAARLAGAPVRALAPARPGGNNRLFRVETAGGEPFALKTYLRQASDPRDRLGTEFMALEFLHRHGITCVPRPIAADAAAGCALHEWIEGEPPAADREALAAALALLGALDRVRDAPDAARLPLASEACLSAGELVAQIERRAAALTAVAGAHPELAAFLRRFRHALDTAIAEARESYARAGIAFDAPIDPERRRLCPSDFGFHNALVRGDGTVIFLDFEYFGWDDPVKVTSDFVLHPGMQLTAEQRHRFVLGATDIFAADPSFAHRLDACLPLYALRWTMILLNEYLPDRWQRRVLAGFRGERSLVLRRQLDKADAMLACLPSLPRLQPREPMAPQERLAQ
jgi:hypothetical protein